MILFVFLLLFPVQIYCQSAEKADALYDRASSLYELARYEEAIELFEQCAEIDSRLGKDRRSDLTYDYKLLGMSHMQLSGMERAEDFLKKALGIFSGLGEAAQEAEIANYLGYQISNRQTTYAK